MTFIIVFVRCGKVWWSFDLGFFWGIFGNGNFLFLGLVNGKSLVKVFFNDYSIMMGGW